MPRIETVVGAASKLFPVDPPSSVLSFFAPRLEAAMLFVTPSVFARFAIAVAAIPAIFQLVTFAVLPTTIWLPISAALLPVQVSSVLVIVHRTSRRRRAVEGELPFVAMLFFILSHESYANLPDAFKKIEQLGPEIFPAFFAEAQNLARNLTYGIEPELGTAERTFVSHPSRQLREFIHGYLTTLETGRDVHEFVRVESERFLTTQEDRWRSFTALLSSMTEVSFIFLAVFPVGVQMIAGTFPGVGASFLLLTSLALLSVVTVALLLWMDFAQPPSHDARYPPALLVCLVLGFLVILALYQAGLIDSVVAAALSLGCASAYEYRVRGFFGRLGEGEKEVAVMLHDLAELTRAGVELPPALSRLIDGSAGFRSIGDDLSAFSRLLLLGQSPLAARRRLAHPSWLVKVSFALLAVSFETGGGYDQLDKLSLSFRRLSDARRSIQASVIPFALLGVVVPVVSSASFWFLRSMQSLGPVLPLFAIQSGASGTGGSIVASSLLAGLIVSKAYSQSLRSMVGVPPLLASALISFLIFGSA
ncbi:MAG: type II secretion system F family protein [Nitrososphaerales archaeon]|nr:type II secretion system F family protein [Nitrososphaerales archaeon]